MTQLTISEVARRVGVRASAIRYYEERKVLAPARRVSGQRRYDETAVYRLAVVRRAQEAGFSLEEIRRLFFGFRESTPISARWRKIAEGKVAELNARIAQIQSMKDLLEKLQSCCRCETVDQCGAGILRSSAAPRKAPWGGHPGPPARGPGG
jgi:MerR family transcriptional regulator, redox-sensitive transcriptional activator SoxR